MRHVAIPTAVIAIPEPARNGYVRAVARRRQERAEQLRLFYRIRATQIDREVRSVTDALAHLDATIGLFERGRSPQPKQPGYRRARDCL